MPCSEYKGAQRKLCFATKEWKNWDDIVEDKMKVRKESIKNRLPFFKLKKMEVKMENKKTKMLGKKNDDYECPFKDMSKGNYYSKDMKNADGKKLNGPEGYWGI